MLPIVRIMTPPVERVDHLPDGSVGLCFLLFGEGRGRLMLVGPSTRALYTRPDPFVLALHVAFPPGAAYRYLGVPVEALVDRHLPAHELWGEPAVRLLDELLALGVGLDGETMAARCAAIRGALEVRARAGERYEPAAAAIARAAVTRLATTAAPIGDLAAALQISERSLRRAFGAAIGVSPKVYARIARFRRVAAGAAQAGGRWAEVARAAGYADQAHLVNEFRALVGVSPSAFVRRDGADHLRVPCPMSARRGTLAG